MRLTMKMDKREELMEMRKQTFAQMEQKLHGDARGQVSGICLN